MSRPARTSPAKHSISLSLLSRCRSYLEATVSSKTLYGAERSTGADVLPNSTQRFPFLVSRRSASTPCFVQQQHVSQLILLFFNFDGMLRLLSRRFTSAKYIYSIQLHGISPWFMHERPAKVVWKRGTQKKRRGATAATMPVLTTKQNMNFCKLQVDERFEIEATLYAVGRHEGQKTQHDGCLFAVGKCQMQRNWALRVQGNETGDYGSGRRR